MRDANKRKVSDNKCHAVTFSIITIIGSPTDLYDARYDISCHSCVLSNLSLRSKPPTNFFTTDRESD